MPRDRHGRGIRGPLALPNPVTGRPVPLRTQPTGAEVFLTAVKDAISRVVQHCPECLNAIDVGIDEVPTQSTLWQGDGDSVIPLAVAVDAENGRPAKVVLYRRPLEKRAMDLEDLRFLVRHTLVEQLSMLTGRSPSEIDPLSDEW